MMNRRLEKKFIQTYDTHFEKIFKYCYYRISDRELAKDLSQQAFMKTWASLQEGSVIDNVRAFVYTTAHNLVVDWYRRKKETSLEVLAENGFDPADLSQNPEHDAEFESLLKILNELSPEDKELVLMRHVEGIKPREIAKQMGTDSNTISVRIHRATRRLKDILKNKRI
jgi:RNA polymerase sigma-70 factor (ECF subfamily)